MVANAEPAIPRASKLAAISFQVFIFEKDFTRFLIPLVGHETGGGLKSGLV